VLSALALLSNMGISGEYQVPQTYIGINANRIGLLPLLKSIHKPCNLRKFEGKTIGVDAYGWLHRGTVACAIELATGKSTRKYAPHISPRTQLDANPLSDL
jgi:hypothetical protein